MALRYTVKLLSREKPWETITRSRSEIVSKPTFTPYLRIIFGFPPKDNEMSVYYRTYHSCQFNWIMEKNFVNVILLFVIIYPLKRAAHFHLNKVLLELPSPKNALCHVWLILAQWFWSRRQNVKGLRQRRRQQQRRRRRTTDKKSHLSLPLRWAKKH